MKKRFLLGTLILSLVLLLSSCYTPSPLYGTWADNNGNKMTFFDDGSFSASVVNNEGKLQVYDGSYTVIDNVLIFKISGDFSYSRNTEWDLNGAVLKLSWTANSTTTNLVLYHTAR